MSSNRVRDLPKYLTITAVAVLALLSAFLARPAEAQYYAPSAVATLTVAAPPDTWTPADMNGQPVYLYCYGGCSGAVSIAGIAPLTYWGCACYYVIQAAAVAYTAPYAATYTTPLSYSTYSAPVTYTAPLYSYAEPAYYGGGLSFPYSTGFYGGCSFGGFSCLGTGCVTVFCGSGFNSSFFGRGNGIFGDSFEDIVCPTGTTKHHRPNGMGQLCY